MQDTTPIVRYEANNIGYDIEDGETEETFTRRVIAQAKAGLISPLAVPCLFAFTTDMLKEEVCP